MVNKKIVKDQQRKKESRIEGKKKERKGRRREGQREKKCWREGKRKGLDI